MLQTLGYTIDYSSKNIKENFGICALIGDGLSEFWYIVLAEWMILAIWGNSLYANI